MIKSVYILALIALALSSFYFLNSRQQQDTIKDKQGNVIPLEPPLMMINDQWSHYQSKYMKIYQSEEEQIKRYKVFVHNYKQIYKHNAQYFNIEGFATYYQDINEFADLTNEEFIKRNGFKVNDMNSFQKQYNKLVVNLNEDRLQEQKQFDWRQKGVIAEIKNQGNCGSCWAFSTAGALESCKKINKKEEIENFSVQQLLDCSTTGGNNGCNGGSMPTAYEYVIENGIMQDSQYPYQGKVQTCKYDKLKTVFEITKFQNVKANDAKQLKAALHINPISIAMDASGVNLQFYKKGVFSTNCGTNLDHAVILVGYGYEKDGHKYYIIRNSWGTSWGEDGYIRIIDNDPNGKGVCGIQMFASYPVFSS